MVSSMATAANARWSRLLVSSVFAVAAVMAAEDPHAVWNRVVKKHVNAIGEVDYGALKSDRADLDAYVKWLGEVSPENKPALFPAKSDELAYYINAYNAFTTAGVVKSYPAKSVRDLGLVFGFFRRDDYTMGGRKISLQDLENKIIRSDKYKEPRIHFAIVCASLSCPKLTPEAFTAANLERLLDAGARQFVNERRNVYVKDGVVTISEIFKWYEGDFKWTASSALEFAKVYAAPDLKNALEKLPSKPQVKYFDYDWAINDPGSRAKAKSEFERELSRRP
jgi:hypothetical protein